MKTVNFYSFTKRELEGNERKIRTTDYRQDHLDWNEIWDRDIWTQTDEDKELAREERMYY